MIKDTLVTFKKPAELQDELTVLLRAGARHLLMQAVEVELEHFLAEYEHVRDAKGRRAIVRNGYLPKRKILTDLSPVEIRVVRTRDRSRSGIVFRSSLLPPYIKRKSGSRNMSIGARGIFPRSVMFTCGLMAYISMFVQMMPGSVSL